MYSKHDIKMNKYAVLYILPVIMLLVMPWIFLANNSEMILGNKKTQ